MVKAFPAIPGIVEEPVEDLSQSLSPSLNNSPAFFTVYSDLKISDVSNKPNKAR